MTQLEEKIFTDHTLKSVIDNLSFIIQESSTVILSDDLDNESNLKLARSHGFLSAARQLLQTAAYDIQQIKS